MATISKLSASLTLNSQAFEARLRSARKGLGSFSSGVVRAAKRVTMLGAASAAAAVGGMSLLVRSSFQTIDSTAKMADVLGLTIDQMRGYQLAAQLAGVSNSDLETGFRRLQKNISDARVGLTTAQRAFDALGVSFDYLNTLSPDQQFKVVADALGNVRSQADRARVAQDLLGRSGIKLIKLMETGSAGIAAVQERSRMLRGELTRLDASKIEAANDAWAEMKTAISGVADQLAVEAAPSVQRFAETVTGNAPAINLFFRNLTDELTRSDSLMGSIVQQAKELLGITTNANKNELVAQLTDVENQISAQEDSAFSKSWWRSREGNLRSLREQARNLRREIQSIELSTQFSQTPSGRRVAARQRMQVPTFAQFAAENMPGVSDVMDDEATSFETVAEETQKYTSVTEDAATATDSLADSIRELAEAHRGFTGMGRAVGRFEQVASRAAPMQITNPNEGLGPPQVFDEAATNRLNAAMLLTLYGTNPEKPVEGDNATALLGQIKNLLQNRTLRASFG